MMKLTDIADAGDASGAALAGIDIAGIDVAGIDIAGLTADSRAVRPGFLFAALSGVKADGVRYIPDALARGAAAILAHEDAAIGPETGIPVIRDANPRRRFALMAAKFWGRQPEVCAAVTGTNGKTSVVSFLRQLWQAQGLTAASLGTIGAVTSVGVLPAGHTTPEPAALHQLLAELAQKGVTHLALEASSHGLAQYRADGVRLAAAAFTNISRDHLDYHPDFESYFAAKLRLFTELAPPGAAAVADMDRREGGRVAQAASRRGLKVMSVGRRGETLRLAASERDGFAQRLTLIYQGKAFAVRLPLAGDFQASNAMAAAALALATGGEAESIFAGLEDLQGAQGRLEFAGATISGAPVFIDYAHTPDALANALTALRPYAAGRLHAVFGCGGDRDRGKRAQMGAVAQDLADTVYITDDNPRGEDPAQIRAAILAAAPGAAEIAERADAIAAAIAALKPGDVLLIAGKGHETGQIIGGKIIPFSDHAAVRAALDHLRPGRKISHG